jgi:hypothetical protein
MIKKVAPLYFKLIATKLCGLNQIKEEFTENSSIQERVDRSRKGSKKTS